ncbi:helix-turn-helix domain-containing protein [Leifsonia sp. 2MCAF36]|uniref:helix-turn-helix domain-containing protein n=1 Tax=Leifsonia sp. 2MCAF36 TaxID=3232988 RepID=UPI003F9DDE24
MTPTPKAAAVAAPARAVLGEVDRLLARLEWTLLDFGQRKLAAGNVVAVPPGSTRFHYVVSGAVETTAGGAPVRLAVGDFLMLPRAGAHRILALQDAVLASGELETAASMGLPLTLTLPETFAACGFVVREPHMGPLIETLGLEFGGVRAGNSVMASRIATIIASAAIRSWVENGCAPDQWLVSVRDPHIARAVAAMQEAPGEPWTVETLARVARASRTVFAERFRELVGDSPSRYLAAVRMEQAGDLLSQGDLSVGAVAHRLGYSSDVAFSRAFRRHTGVSPAAWRREADSRVQGVTA